MTPRSSKHSHTAPRRSRLVAYLAGFALVAAGVGLPAVAASAASTKTYHGTVVSGATKLSDVTVGFWSRTGHKLASTKTTSSGKFTLKVPSGVLGFAYAGPRPDAAGATFIADRLSVVRGIIGASQAAGTSYRIYQGHASATTRNLGNNTSTLKFDLQKTGTLNGSSMFIKEVPQAVQLERLNGTPVGAPQPLSSDGSFSIHPRVPGKYKLLVTPIAGYLPKTVAVTVLAGKATTVALGSFTRGAVLSGSLTSGGSPLKSAVYVSVLKHNTTTVVAGAESSATGTYSIAGLHAGAYDVVYGRNPAPNPDADPVTPATPVTSNDYLVLTKKITIDAAHDDVTGNYAVAAAAQVVGTAIGVTTATAIYVEQSDASIVRATETDADGAFTIGGLAPGTPYEIFADTGTTYGSVATTPTPGANGSLSIYATSHPALTVTGEAGKGHFVELTATHDVYAGNQSINTTASTPTASTYKISGLVPGQYSLINAVPKHLAAAPVIITLTSDTVKNLAAGPANAVFKAAVKSGSAPILTLSGKIKSANAAPIGIGVISKNDGQLATNGLVDNVQLRAGIYHYVAGSFTGPASDGPWWFGAPSGTFKLTAGKTTNVGTLALHVHTSL
jgi:hypothetical protein